jgi:hypothetical protein
MEKLNWTKKGHTHILKNGESVLLTLHIHPTTGADFILNGKEYTIGTKGIWSRYYYITSGENEILKLTHNFWSSKGKITFNDGSECTNEYTSKGGLKLRFADAENEILSYSMVFENKKPTLKFKLGLEMIDAEKLLILAALGMTLFSGILQEIGGDGDAATMVLLATA